MAAAAITAFAGSFATDEASADAKTDYDYSEYNGSGTYFVHTGPPTLAASVYAGNNVAGGVTETSFIISWTSYPSGYRIWVRNDCFLGSRPEVSAWVTGGYAVAQSTACTSGVVGARGQITH